MNKKRLDSKECMCAAVAVLWSVRASTLCVTQQLQKEKCWQTRGALKIVTTITVWLCVPQEDTERSCKHQRRPNPRDTLCLHHLIFTANCSNLIWYAYHFWGAAGEWALGTTQTTVFTMNNLSNPKKIQQEYMEELAQLDAVIIALLLLPRWISGHSKSTWCGCCGTLRKTTHKSI